MNTKPGGFEDRAQIRNRRPLAIGAGYMDHRRQPAFGMIKPLQQTLHPLQIEIDTFGMQGRQPCDQVAERRRLGRR